MTNTKITERQHYWRDHVLAAAAYSGTVVEYAKANKLNTKCIYQWKTALTKRGLLPIEKESPTKEFIAVRHVHPVAHGDQVEMTCRRTLACGAVLEFYTLWIVQFYRSYCQRYSATAVTTELWVRDCLLLPKTCRYA